MKNLTEVDPNPKFLLTIWAHSCECGKSFTSANIPAKHQKKGIVACSGKKLFAINANGAGCCSKPWKKPGKKHVSLGQKNVAELIALTVVYLP